MPYDRNSDYFEHVRDAEKALEEMINKRKGKRLDLLQLVPFTQSRKKRAFFLASSRHRACLTVAEATLNS